MKYDIALIGTGGPIADAIVKKISHSGLKIIGIGRRPPGSAQLLENFIEFDIENPSAQKQPISAKTIFFNAAIKGRFTQDSENFARQGAVSAPDFFKLFSLLNVDCDRLMTMGSSEEYGPRETSAEIFEYEELRPISSYGQWKRRLFENAQKWSTETGRPHLHLRPFNVFGPNSDSKMFIGGMISTFLNGEIFKTTKGEQWRSFVSISLLSLCIDKLMSSTNWKNLNRAGGFNLSAPNYLQLKEVVKLTQDLIPAAKVDFGAIAYRQDEVWHQNPNLDLMRELLGKDSGEDFKLKLRETIEHYHRL